MIPVVNDRAVPPNLEARQYMIDVDMANIETRATTESLIGMHASYGGTQALRYTSSLTDWIPLYTQSPIPEARTAQEINNDRHSPNRQRRPQNLPSERNVSRHGHSRRHRN